MKNARLLLVLIIMLPFACKKETTRVSPEPIEPAEPVAQRPQCIEDYWQIGQYFYGGKSPNYTNNIPYPLVYNNKVYNFDVVQDEVRIYNGSGWDSIPSAVPFSSFGRPNFGFVIGNKGYLGNIDISQLSHPFYEYDFASNTWAQKANFPGERRIATSAAFFTLAGKGYVVGGLGEVNRLATTFSDTWAYDPVNDSWTPKANVPLANRATYATGFSVNSKGYMVNGQYATETTTTWLKQLVEYDPVADAWSAKALFPGIARYNTAVFVIGSTAYAGGGRKTVNYYKDFYKYSPGSNTWTQVDDITVNNPTIGGFTLNSKGYVEVMSQNPNPNFLMKYNPKSCVPLPVTPN